ncbi:PHP domain-containing protein [Sporolactobacillus spathodeae]|uniref:Histidinol-phosphatase n=1 Tax=Sporolactobacillus spathodeae TaxID=1465502 RepID=A0ABS2QB46_9BACL|nr:PHP domain-containing protein [Sporolactobacillus spathodeae]MBM7659043.1 histidinol-phosphatase (PHP family) [Sporolactobacillus spathodeae]
MPFDTHNHTVFSFDAEMNLDDALRRAEAYNLGLVLTEHYDLNEKQEDGTPVSFAVDDYLRTYAARRGPRLLLGIELGLDNRPEYVNKNKQIVETHDFDMVIGSVHNIQDYDIYTDRNRNLLSKEQFFTKYLIYAEHTINANPYIDTFAHMDYPCRYLNYGDNTLRYEDFPWLIDNFLSALIEHEICFEINLRLVADQVFRDSLSGILKRYRALGGRYVTIGGDNHVPETIGTTYSLGVGLAQANGLVPVYFKNREMCVDDPQNFKQPL